MGLVGELSRHHNLYAWSLTDEELRAYYESNKNMAEIFSAIGVGALSTPSVAAVAAAIYDAAKNGVKGQVRASVKATTTTPRVAEVAKRMGVGPQLTRGLGVATLAALAAMALLNTNASGNQKRAEKEQALRNLTHLED
jgi:bacterioferritin-associated ferredoxin